MRLIPTGFRQVELGLTKWKLQERTRLKAILDNSHAIIVFDAVAAPTLINMTLETITEQEFFNDQTT